MLRPGLISRHGGAPSGAASYISEVLADSPWIYLPHDEASGATLNDESGSSRDLAITGTPLYSQAGAGAGTASSLKWVSAAYATASSLAVPYSLPFTVEMWIKPSDTSFGQMVVARESSWSFGFTGAAELWINAHAVDDLVSVGAALSTSVFQHCVAVYRADAKVDFYKNGVFVSTTANTATPPAGNDTPIVARRTLAGSNSYTGWVDEVAVYPVALSAVRILAHYTAGA